MKVALIQMSAGTSKSANLRKALLFVDEAARQHARLVCLPEVFNFRGDDQHLVLNSENIPGHSTQPFMNLAKKKRLWILLGSIAEFVPRSRKVHNTSILINDKGRLAAVYRKQHLFDMTAGKQKILESTKVIRGKRAVLCGIDGIKTGLSICYDLRFPDMYHAYARQGARILLVPSNFTALTGKAHWEILLKARAIENQCFVIAPNQCGVGTGGIRSYGNSMVVDPWGKTLTRGGLHREGVLTTTLNFSTLDSIRRKLPSLKESLQTTS